MASDEATLAVRMEYATEGAQNGPVRVPDKVPVTVPPPPQIPDVPAAKKVLDVYDRALAQMGREANQEAVHKARMEIDPEYAKKNQPKEQPSGSIAGTVAQVLKSIGMGGIGGVIGSFAGAGAGGAAGAGGSMAGLAMAGPVGAIIAAIGYTVQKLEEGVRSAFALSSAMLSMDPQRFARAFGDLTEKIPLLGGVIGGVVSGILGMADQVKATATHLSQYNGALASQIAMQEVRQIQRDINRAQRFGPDLFKAMEARQNFNDKLNDLVDKHMPRLLEIATAGLNILGPTIELVERQTVAIINLPRTIASAFGVTLPSLLGEGNDIARRQLQFLQDAQLSSLGIDALQAMARNMNFFNGDRPQARQPNVPNFGGI